MQRRFTRAIVRSPPPNFADGLTTVELGPPNYERAMAQHGAYCAALARCGLAVIKLPADRRYPDSTFVEDTAVLTPRGAILTRPGASSRLDEVSGIKDGLSEFFPSMLAIQPPGTVDGGDVCEAGEHFFIGISTRTNEMGAHQLAELLASFGYTSSFVDIRSKEGILHLKSGIAYLGDERLAVIEALAQPDAFVGLELIRAEAGDAYAVNCVRVNDHILLAAGHPALDKNLRELGYKTIAIEMSEFRKMDGGLSCLSLRF
jgi:dimethylargininase